MKKTALALGLSTLLASAAFAETVGVTMARFDDNFLTVLRNDLQKNADSMDGVDVQIEDAQNDVARQLDQINNFVASGVDAIIVNPVDTSATEAMTNAAASAGVPLVYVNRQPINLDTLPDNQTFVASNEIESGTLEAFEMCKILRAMGKGGTGARAYIIMGELSNQAAIQRTKDVDDIIGIDMCSFIEIIDRQTSNWQRDQAQNLMTNWLSSGEPFDAVFANNDESAIGAIQAIKAAGISMDDVVIGGVDATQDALVAMQSGELDVTVFQNAAAQGSGSARCRAAVGPRRRRAERRVDSVRAGDPGQYRRVPVEELSRFRRTARSGAPAPLQCACRVAVPGGRTRRGFHGGTDSPRNRRTDLRRLEAAMAERAEHPCRSGPDRADLRGARGAAHGPELPVRQPRPVRLHLQRAAAANHHPAGSDHRDHRARRDPGDHLRRNRPVLGLHRGGDGDDRHELRAGGARQRIPEPQGDLRSGADGPAGDRPGGRRRALRNRGGSGQRHADRLHADPAVHRDARHDGHRARRRQVVVERKPRLVPDRRLRVDRFRHDAGRVVSCSSRSCSTSS